MTDILGWLSPAIAAVLFLGAAAVYLRGSRDKGTIATLSANNAALAERVKILEDGEAERSKKLAAIEAENARLTTMVTARDMIAELATELKTHRATLVKSLDRIHEDLARIQRNIEEAR